MSHSIPCKDTQHADILDVMTEQVGTNHCILTTVPLSQDNMTQESCCGWPKQPSYREKYYGWSHAGWPGLPEEPLLVPSTLCCHRWRRRGRTRILADSVLVGLMHAGFKPFADGGEEEQQEGEALKSYLVGLMLAGLQGFLKSPYLIPQHLVLHLSLLQVHSLLHQRSLILFCLKVAGL